MKRVALIFLVPLAACTTNASDYAVGWTVDPSFRALTTMQMFLYGPAVDVDAVIADARSHGWKLVERSLVPSGSALALIEGPLDPGPNAYIDAII